MSLEISKTGARLMLILSDFNRLFFSMLSSFIKAKPPSLYKVLGDKKALLRKFLLLLILTTVPPYSSTPRSKGIEAFCCKLLIIFITSSLVLFLKASPNKTNPPKWYFSMSPRLLEV